MNHEGSIAIQEETWSEFVITQTSGWTRCGDHIQILLSV